MLKTQGLRALAGDFIGQISDLRRNRRSSSVGAFAITAGLAPIMTTGAALYIGETLTNISACRPDCSFSGLV